MFKMYAHIYQTQHALLLERPGKRLAWKYKHKDTIAVVNSNLFIVKKKVSLLEELTFILLIATVSLITACETACFSVYSQNVIQEGVM